MSVLEDELRGQATAGLPGDEGPFMPRRVLLLWDLEVDVSVGQVFHQ